MTRIIEQPQITATDATTFAPVTHGGGDGRVCLGPATTERAGLMTPEMVAQLEALAGGMGAMQIQSAPGGVMIGGGE